MCSSVESKNQLAKNAPLISLHVDVMAYRDSSVILYLILVVIRWQQSFPNKKKYSSKLNVNQIYIP